MFLDEEEIIHITQEWFGCDGEQAKGFAKELCKLDKTKTVYIEWIPQIVAFSFLIIYLIFHW